MKREQPGRQAKWTNLGGRYPDALREWAKLEGALCKARTVAQAIERYLTERGPELADKTLSNYRSTQRRLNEWCGSVYLDELTRQDVRTWLHARTAPISANRDKALLSAAYAYAVECGWCNENPARGVRRRREKPRERFASAAEQQALLDAAPPLWRALLTVELLTGMRQGEIRTLRRDHITNEGIELFRPKTGKATLIEWSPTLRAAIDAALKAHPPRRPSVYVFPTRTGGPYSGDGFRTMFARLRQAAGVSGLEFRDLRRTAANESPSLDEARDLLGHLSTETTSRVYRVRDRAKPTR